MSASEPDISFKDQAANYISVYGGGVWAFAKSRTDSELDAECAVREIFKKLWICLGEYQKSGMSESECIELICRQWLFKRMNTKNY